ncbi:hypothetical protein [Paenibacillus oleatilyticus]|uniref:hypothetical protein n=1 Tax=Paenibacillus oleatilyticus TaxID=2594886 RepID=UPI001C20099E|nr:hypothetical protein [Paenibacillus oleatilyticus]MBU7316010.1 hypothetical protein [Paenibacillus oleatilyticus]
MSISKKEIEILEFAKDCIFDEFNNSDFDKKIINEFKFYVDYAIGRIIHDNMYDL